MLGLNGSVKFRKNSASQNVLCRLAVFERTSRDSHQLDGGGEAADEEFDGGAAVIAGADKAPSNEDAAPGDGEQPAAEPSTKTMPKQEWQSVQEDVKQALQKSTGKRSLLLSQQSEAAAAAAAAKKPNMQNSPLDNKLPPKKIKAEADTLALFTLHS